MPLSLIQGLSREKTISLGVSVAFNLIMIAVLASSLAGVGVGKVEEGASLVVIGLTGGEAADEAEAEKEPSRPAPPPVSEPPPSEPDFVRQDEKPLEPKVALLERPEPVAERPAAAPAHPKVDPGPSPEQLREAAEQQRKAQEAARARAAEQAQSEARAAAAASARSDGRADGGYKAQVWQHLQRFRRSNTVGAGETLVRFTIDDGGGVLNLGVARSSGSAAFDREALQMVRRAAPFPKPPPGVGRSFVFAIEGK